MIMHTIYLFLHMVFGNQTIVVQSRYIKTNKNDISEGYG